jgi:hypothetical protein
MARLEGLEPPTYRFEVCRSIQLSYRRVLKTLSVNGTGRNIGRQPASIEASLPPQDVDSHTASVSGPPSLLRAKIIACTTPGFQEYHDCEIGGASRS